MLSAVEIVLLNEKKERRFQLFYICTTRIPLINKNLNSCLLMKTGQNLREKKREKPFRTSQSEEKSICFFFSIGLNQK